MLKNVWTVAYQHGSIVTKTIVPHLPSDRAVEIQYGEIVVGPYSSCHLYQTKDFLNSKIHTDQFILNYNLKSHQNVKRLCTTMFSYKKQESFFL